MTDTFQAYEDYINEPAKTAFSMLDENSERLKRQNETPITIIFGNPPYSAGQRSANDNAQNKKYDTLDNAIANSYAALSTTGLKSKLYDSYFRAFRFATDKLKDGDGIVCFISNGSWLDGNSTMGFRKSIEKEFSKIYVFNIRGDARTVGELNRKEGHPLFGATSLGGGSKTPIAITLLVKRQNHKGKAEIFYHNIGDYLKRNEKLSIINRKKSFLDSDMALVKLTPNEYNDWITTRNETFYEYIPLASEKKFDVKTESVFVVNSLGCSTNRDIWVYNFSRESVLENMQNMINYFNSQINNDEPVKNPEHIAWSSGFDKYFKSRIKINFEESKVTLANYRPFTKQLLYYGEKIIDRRGQMNDFFPIKSVKKLVIAINCKNNKGLTCIAVDKYADLHFIGDTQCFPLYYYEKSDDTGGQGSLFDDSNNTPQYIRKDGVSDYILKQTREKCGAAVTKEDVFFYVYGYLHSPTYRTTFADDLKKSLPRIPLVEKSDEFWTFSKAGRELAELHLNYEEVKPLPDVEVKGDNGNYRVEKMRFKSKADKSVIVYNSAITIENIPLKAYEYVVNGKSAIEWVMERYQIKTDKDSGIVNDPNLYAEEVGNERYVLDLLLSVITVSVRTVGIVEGLS